MTELVHSVSGSQGRCTFSHVASASGRTGKIIMEIKPGLPLRKTLALVCSNKSCLMRRKPITGGIIYSLYLSVSENIDRSLMSSTKTIAATTFFRTDVFNIDHRNCYEQLVIQYTAIEQQNKFEPYTVRAPIYQYPI